MPDGSVETYSGPDHSDPYSRLRGLLDGLATPTPDHQTEDSGTVDTVEPRETAGDSVHVDFSLNGQQVLSPFRSKIQGKIEFYPPVDADSLEPVSLESMKAEFPRGRMIQLDGNQPSLIGFVESVDEVGGEIRVNYIATEKNENNEIVQIFGRRQSNALELTRFNSDDPTLFIAVPNEYMRQLMLQRRFPVGRVIHTGENEFGVVQNLQTDPETNKMYINYIRIKSAENRQVEEVRVLASELPVSSNRNAHQFEMVNVNDFSAVAEALLEKMGFDVEEFAGEAYDAEASASLTRGWADDSLKKPADPDDEDDSLFLNLIK